MQQDPGCDGDVERLHLAVEGNGYRTVGDFEAGRGQAPRLGADQELGAGSDGRHRWIGVPVEAVAQISPLAARTRSTASARSTSRSTGSRRTAPAEPRTATGW